jgi:hypothetical protein
MIYRGRTLTTYGQIGAAAVELAKAGDREEAERFLEAYASELHGWKKARVEFNQPDGSMGKSPMEIARSNIGYLSGYYDHETGQRVRDFFDVDHPVFGRKAPDDPRALLEMGKRMGGRMR